VGGDIRDVTMGFGSHCNGEAIVVDALEMYHGLNAAAHTSGGFESML